MRGDTLFTRISITIETSIELDVMLHALELYTDSLRAVAARRGETDDNAAVAERMRLVIAETAGL